MTFDELVVLAGQYARGEVDADTWYAACQVYAELAVKVELAELALLRRTQSVSSVEPGGETRLHVPPLAIHTTRAEDTYRCHYKVGGGER